MHCSKKWVEMFFREARIFCTSWFCWPNNKFCTIFIVPNVENSSCFHYTLFIMPRADTRGKTARLWSYLVASAWRWSGLPKIYLCSPDANATFIIKSAVIQLTDCIRPSFNCIMWHSWTRDERNWSITIKLPLRFILEQCFIISWSLKIRMQGNFKRN